MVRMEKSEGDERPSVRLDATKTLGSLAKALDVLLFASGITSLDVSLMLDQRNVLLRLFSLSSSLLQHLLGLFLRLFSVLHFRLGEGHVILVPVEHATAASSTSSTGTRGYVTIVIDGAFISSEERAATGVGTGAGGVVDVVGGFTSEDGHLERCRIG